MKQTVSSRSIVVATKDQLACDLAGEAVILHLKTGIYYGLDAVGARVWSLIQASLTVAEIQAVLLEEYEVAPDQCERDLLALLQDLAAAGLIEVNGEDHL